MQVLWRFIDFENLKTLGFDLSAVQGAIPPLSEIKICIEFTGFKAQIVNTSLTYEVSTTLSINDTILCTMESKGEWFKMARTGY